MIYINEFQKTGKTNQLEYVRIVIWGERVLTEKGHHLRY